MRAAIDGTIGAFGRIDVLVNHVGYNVPELGVDVTEASWTEIMQINATGPFFCAQSVDGT